MMVCLIILVDGSVHEVYDRQHVFLCDELGEMAERVRVKASFSELEVEPKCDGDQESGEADNHHNKLLAEEGGDEAASEQGAEQTVIRLLGGGSGLVLPHGVVIVIIALVTNGGGLRGAVTVTTDGLCLGGSV